MNWQFGRDDWRSRRGEIAMRWHSCLGKGLSAVIAAALIWGSTLPAAAAVLGPQPDSGAPVPSTQMLGWIQEAAEPPLEQVGEGEGDDVETLDEGEPAAQTEPAVSDVETLDEGVPPATQEGDVEPLDQGSPPVAPTTTEPVVTTAAPAPVAEGTVAAEPAGPAVPPGFGTGRVHAVAGHASVPPGLESCHVGAVTGRAYVGIDCGESGSVVGHAPTIEDFPFVLESNFPFDEGNPFTEPVFQSVRDDSVGADDVEVIAAASTDVAGFFGEDEAAPTVAEAIEATFFSSEETAPPVIETTGSSTVEFAQRARDRKPRVRTQRARAERSEESSKKRRAQSNSSSARDDGKSEKASNKSNKRDDRAGGGGKKDKKKAKSNNKKNDKKQGKQKQKGKKKQSNRNRR